MHDLIRPDGSVEFGFFPHPPRTISHQNFDLRSPMDTPIKGWRKNMGYNQFQFIGLTGDDLILGVAIVNLKWVSNAFVYLYEPKSKRFEEFSWLMPLAWNTTTSDQPNEGVWSFKSGKHHIEMKAGVGQRQLKMNLNNQVLVDVCIDESQSYNPLPVCCRAGYNGWVFTNKVTTRSVSGSVKWGDSSFNTESLLASVDWSCGYMRRETFWNWASLSYQTQDGTKIGFNLAAGVNETSYTENGLWINDQLVKLDRAEFQFDRQDRLKPWRISTSDGKVNLTFQPEGTRKEKINALVLASNFTQVFGRFYGVVKDQHDREIELPGVIGFCEDHYAKW